MGTFYCSVTVNGPTQAELARYLTQRACPAFVSVAIKGIATIFPVEYQRGIVASYRFEAPARYRRGETGWEPLVSDLSRQFACPAFAVEECDSDILYYQLYDTGQLTDEVSCPADYFGPFRSRTPTDLNAFLSRSNQDHAALLCAAFGSTASDDVARCLAQPTNEIIGHAVDVHQVLVDMLGLPIFAGYWGLLAAYGSRDADFGQGDKPAFVSTPPHWRPTFESP